MKCFGCSKEIKIQKTCDYCDYIFCSDSCYQAHSIAYHRIHKHNKKIITNNIQIQNIQQKKFIPDSKYLVKGYILPKIVYDNTYELNNFVPVMDKNNPRIIGSGSYGQVFLAFNTIDKKLYAIKHMEKDCLQNALHSLSGIYTEIEIQSRIRHPNIIQLLYVKETKTSFDLVMDYANSGSLFDYIRRNKGLSESKSFQLFIQVVNAIYFLHDNDLIHRDIKPENILLFDYNNVKLCDFGWCVRLNGGQRGTFCGTTEYMAPEMVNQKEYSKEIDVWSLGVLLYEMLHGYSPFIPNKKYFNEREVMENIKIHRLKFDKKVSEDCKDLIFHLLDENRGRRYKVEDIFYSNFVKRYENNKAKIRENIIKVHRNKTPNIKEIKKLNINYNDERQPIIVKRINDDPKNKIIMHKKEYYFNNVKNIQKFDNYSNVQHLHGDYSKDKIKPKKYISNNTAKNFYPKAIAKTREKEIINLCTLEKPIIINNNNEIKIEQNDIHNIVYHSPNKNNSLEKIQNNNQLSTCNNQINPELIYGKDFQDSKNNNNIYNSPTVSKIKTKIMKNSSSKKDKDFNNTTSNISQHYEQKIIIKNNENTFNEKEKEKNAGKKENEREKTEIAREYSYESITENSNNNNSNNISKEEIITPIAMVKKLPVNAGNSLINQYNNSNNINIKTKKSFAKKNSEKNENINHSFYGNFSSKNQNPKSYISYQPNRCYLLNYKNKSPIMVRNISEINFDRLNKNKTNPIDYKEKKPQSNFIKEKIHNISNKAQTIELKSESNNKSFDKYSKYNNNDLIYNINIAKKIPSNTNTNFYRKKSDLNKCEDNISPPKNMNNGENISPNTNKNSNLIKDNNLSSNNLYKNIVYSNINYVIINNNSSHHVTQNNLDNATSLMDEAEEIEMKLKQAKNNAANIPNDDHLKNNITINNNNNSSLLTKYNNDNSEIFNICNESFTHNIDNNKTIMNKNNYYNTTLNFSKKSKSKSVSKCKKMDMGIQKPFNKENNVNNLNILNNLTVTNNPNNYNKGNNKIKDENNKKIELKKNLSEFLLKKRPYKNDKIKQIKTFDGEDESNKINRTTTIQNKDNNSFNEEKEKNENANKKNNYIINSYNNKEKIECIKETFISDYSRVIDEIAFDGEEIVDDSQKTPRKVSDKVKIFPKELLGDFNKNIRNKSKAKKKK